MRRNSKAAALALLLAACGRAGALDIVSASVTRQGEGRRADLALSGGISLRNVAFEKGAVLMPASEYKGRTYADIKALSGSFYRKMEACFLKDKCSSSSVSVPSLAPAGVKPLKSEVRFANVSLSFDGDLLVVFGAMRKSGGALWVSFPDNFSVSDQALRRAINEAVALAVKDLPAERTPARAGPAPSPVRK